METLTERPKERLKSFDILANVEALRFDIDHYGYVLDATREQVGNEQLSYLVEGMDRAARPGFVLKRSGEDLVYFDEGRLRPYGEMLRAGLEANRHDAFIDPRRQFLVEWAQNDYYHYSQFRKLEPGEQYVWESRYPYEVETLYGAKFAAECGLRPDRKMGFLNRAFCLEDGSILMESQTIDRSDDEAFDEVKRSAVENPGARLDALTFIYDSVLARKYGGNFFAGRRGAERDEDAWQQIWQNQDLINYLLDGLESLAWKSSRGHDVEEATKRHIYGVWALFKKRLNREVEASGDFLGKQVYAAFQEYAEAGHMLIGCGGSVEVPMGETEILNASMEDVFSAIFGIEFLGTCEFTSEKCPVCGEKDAKTKAENGKYVHVGKGCKSD